MAKKYRTIPRLYTPVQAAVKLRKSPEGIKWLARKNRIGYFQLPTGNGDNGRDVYYFTDEDIRRFRQGLGPIPQSKR